MDEVEINLDQYFDKYPEIPLEVIVKEDLLRLGIKFTEAALNAATGCRPKSYFLFSYYIQRFQGRHIH